jgi:hypothetical protein
MTRVKFSAEFFVDARLIAPGEHTLQIQGVGTDGFIKAANLGVLVEQPVRIDHRERFWASVVGARVLRAGTLADVLHPDCQKTATPRRVIGFVRSVCDRKTTLFARNCTEPHKTWHSSHSALAPVRER